jgi:hypothetical protein
VEARSVRQWAALVVGCCGWVVMVKIGTLNRMTECIGTKEKEMTERTD